MEKPTHTPGPWTLDRTDGLAPVFILPRGTDDSRFSIGKVDSIGTYHPDGLTAARAEMLANARLIASAPELLGALEAIVSNCCECSKVKRDREPGACEFHSDARAAIAKAKA